MNCSARIKYITQIATNITDKKKWVVNMSSRQLTHIETDLLAKDLNLSINSKTFPHILNYF